jgi:hypothetical protein
MKNIWINHKIWVVISGYFVLVFLFIYFLIFPLVSKVKLASDRMQEGIIDRELEDEKIKKLPQIEGDWESVKASEESLNVILSKEKEVEFIENMEAIAAKTNNLMTLDIQDNLNQQEINKLKKAGKKKEGEKNIMDDISYDSFFPVQIGLLGDYAGLVNFIHMLENSRIYVNVIAIKIKKEEVVEKNVVASAEEAPDKKEILNSTINAIVYTKK